VPPEPNINDLRAENTGTGVAISIVGFWSSQTRYAVNLQYS